MSSSEYLVIGIGAFLGLVAFFVLIMVPALSGYGRYWEKATASLLSLIILAVLLGVGVTVGAAVFRYWDSMTGIF